MKTPIEDIFKGSHNLHNKRAKAKWLRSEGLSYYKIADRLGVSKQYIIKILKSSIGNEGGNQITQKTTKPFNDCQSVADLKIWIALNLITTKDLQNLKQAIEETINKRLNHIQKQLNKGIGAVTL